MRVLRLEHKNEYGEWVTMGGQLEDGGRPGTLSNNTEDGGRDVIRFSMKNGRSIIERSRAGIDVASVTIRMAVSLGWETLATLSDGETFEMLIQTDGMAQPMPVRFHQIYKP